MADNNLQLDDLKIKISVDPAQAKAGINAIATALSQMASGASKTSQALKNITAEMTDMGKESSESATEVETSADTTSNAIQRVGDYAKKSVSKVRLLATALTAPFQVAGGVLGLVAGKLANLWGAVKRVAFYRLIRTAIKEVTQAISEGLEILVEWDRTYGNNTSNAAKTTDELYSKWLELKKAVGAAFMPLMQIAQPALEWLMQGIINIANGFQQILRAIQGYSTYMKATYVFTKKTTDKTKELKRVLFGFDELNVLNSNGGTGALNSVSPIDFVETESDEKLVKFGKGVKAAADFTKQQFSDAWKETQEGWETFKTWWTTKFKPAVKSAADFTSEQFKTSWEETKEGWDTFKTWWDTSFCPAVSTAADFTKQQFSSAWQETKDGWETFKNGIGTFGDWINEKIAIPIRELVIRFYEWMLTNHPKLAAFLGISPEKIEEIRLEIKALTKQDENTQEIVALAGYADGATTGGIKVKFNTDTTLSPDTQRLLSLLKVGKEGITLAAGSSNLKFSLKGGKLPSNILFADGGYIPDAPNTGSLFVAGEAGAELVTHMKGGTGVTNVDQIQEAMTNANTEVVNAVYAMANLIASAVNNKNFDVYMDTAKVGRSVTNYQNNYVRQYGG